MDLVDKDSDKLSIRKQIKIFEDENLLFFKKPIKNFVNILLDCCIIGAILLFLIFPLIYSGHTPELSTFNIIIFLILGIFIILGLIFHLNRVIRTYKTEYYITSKRVIKKWGKGFFSFIKKNSEEIMYDNVNFKLLEEPFNILINYRDSKDNLSYNGEEKSYLHNFIRKLPYLQIRIEKHKGLEIRRTIMNILKEIIPDKNHPYLEDLFVRFIK